MRAKNKKRIQTNGFKPPPSTYADCYGNVSTMSTSICCDCLSFCNKFTIYRMLFFSLIYKIVINSISN